jgi:hypothetical protein
MIIAHKLIIIVFRYLRTINNNKGGYFYKVFEVDLKESREGV